MLGRSHPCHAAHSNLATYQDLASSEDLMSVYMNGCLQATACELVCQREKGK